MGTHWGVYSQPIICGLLAKKPTKLSLRMHNAGFKALGIPFTYVAFDTEETEYSLQAMKRLTFRGFSLTIPHKESALQFVDSISPEAKEIGAINTVINTGEKLIGYNTDWEGIVEAFKEISFGGQKKAALIYGAGGASKAAVFALRKLGLQDISIANRTDTRAQNIAKESKIKFLKHDEINDTSVTAFDVIINATPLGSSLTDGAQFPFNPKAFSSKHVVFDMVTKQETALLTGARESGARTISGLRMLLFQALAQFVLFTEKQPPRSEMERALYDALAA